MAAAHVTIGSVCPCMRLQGVHHAMAWGVDEGTYFLLMVDKVAVVLLQHHMHLVHGSMVRGAHGICNFQRTRRHEAVGRQLSSPKSSKFHIKSELHPNQTAE